MDPFVLDADALARRAFVLARAMEVVPEITGGKLYANDVATGARTLLANSGNPTNARVAPDGMVLWSSDTGDFARPADGSTPAVPQIPTTDGAMWGDSLSAGLIPGAIASALGVAIFNGGVSGQASSDIAVRQGGLQPLLTVTGNQIPATGPVTVTAVAPTTSFRSEGVTNFTFTGTLAGIPGTLKHFITDSPAGTWTFTRTADGAATLCPAGTPFLGTQGDAYRDRFQIIWVGRNNINAGSNLADARRDIASMVAHLRPYSKRYLVVGVTNALNEIDGTANHTAIVEHNAILASLYGERFVDIRRYLIDHGLESAGLTPTTQDLADIANDTVPTQLHSDNIHFTSAGAHVVADRLASIVAAKTWVTVPEIPTTGLIADWNALSIGGAEGDDVIAWADDVGGVVLTSTGGASPTLTTDPHGGPAVDFGGAARLDNTAFAVTSDETMVAVVRFKNLASAVATHVLVGSTDGTKRRRLLVTKVGGVYHWQAAGPTNVDTLVATDAAWQVLGARFAGNTTTVGPSGVRVGATEVKGSIGTNTHGGMRLGCSDGGTYAECQIARLLVYNAAVSDADFEQLFSALSAAHGVTA